MRIQDKCVCHSERDIVFDISFFNCKKKEIHRQRSKRKKQCVPTCFLRVVNKKGIGSKKETRNQGGLGINIISTSRGLMTGRQAVREGVGGEILCNVW